MSFYDLFSSVFAGNGLERYVSRETSEKFELLCEVLKETNSKYNLTAITDDKSVVLKHFADSAFAAAYIPDGSEVIDVGAGAGFPSLPVAILKDGVKVVSLDSTSKKLAFVESAANRLGLSNVTTFCARAEEAGREAEHREKYDVCIARAVAGLPVLSELCLPFVRKGGSFIAMKGPSLPEELISARSALSVLGADVPETVSYTLKYEDVKEDRALLIARKKQYTPGQYPRQYAKMLKKPL